MIPTWKNENVSSNFGSFFSYFSIVNHLSKMDYYYVLVIFYVIIGFLIFMLFVCLIINIMLLNVNKHNLETSHLIFMIFRIFFEFLQIIFFPITELFFFLFKCNSVNGTIVHEVFPGVYCFTGTNLVHIFVSIMGIFVIVFGAIFLVKYGYENRSKSHLWLAK